MCEENNFEVKGVMIGVILGSIMEPHWGLVFWTTLFFLIFLLILRRFAWPKILASIEAREKYIRESLEEAKRVKEEISRIEKERERILSEALNEQSRILSNAREEAKRIIDRAREEALQEQKKIIESAVQEINLYRDKVVEELKRTALNMAIDIAREIMREELSHNGKSEQYYKKLLKEMEAKL